MQLLHRQFVRRGVGVADQQDVLDAHGNVVVLEPFPHPVGLAVRRLSGHFVPAGRRGQTVDLRLRHGMHLVPERLLVGDETVEIGRLRENGVRGHDDEDFARNGAGFARGRSAGVPRPGGRGVGHERQGVGVQDGVGSQRIRPARFQAAVGDAEFDPRNLPENALRGIVEGWAQRHAHELPPAHLRNAFDARGFGRRERIGPVDGHVFPVDDGFGRAIERNGVPGRRPRRSGTHGAGQREIGGFHGIDDHGNRGEVGIGRKGVGDDPLGQARPAGFGRKRGALAARDVREPVRCGNRERRKSHRNRKAVGAGEGRAKQNENSANEFQEPVFRAHDTPPRLKRFSKTFNLRGFILSIN